MNWNLQPEIPYTNTGFAYSSSGVVMDFFEGLTYEHVNFIFSDPSYGQDCVHPVINTSAYKFGFSEPASFSYYDYCHPYEIGDHTFVNNEYSRHFEDSSMVADERSTAVDRQHDGHSSSQSHANSAECLQSYHSPHDYQVIWQDNVDPDNMTYEELLELGEVVGTQSRGLPQELISLLPISKFKCGFFSRKKRDERCVICQMEYKRGDRRITLPCNHIYHAGCGSRWLSINKACPICYKDVHVHAPKH